jgi:hypothetical protein
MKKLVLAATAALALTLTGCGAGNGYDGYSSNGGYTSTDWDMNNPSLYNNNTYCGGGTYNPMPNNQFTCVRNGVTAPPSARPQPVIPPKTQQKAPVQAPKPAAPAPKAPAPAYKAPAPPAPKAPAPKTGK